MSERNNIWLKKIDYYIGCPLVYFLGFFRSKRSIIPKQVKRVLLIKTAGIGDTVLVGAIVLEIKQQYPKAQIDIVCSKNNAAMAKMLPGISEVYIFNMKAPFKSLRLLRKLEQFDLLIDFAPWPRINAVVSYVVDATFKVGFKRKDMYRHYIYDSSIEHLDTVHEIDNYRNLIKAVGIYPNCVVPLLPIKDIKKNIISGEYAILHLYPGGAMQKQRMWDVNKWVCLAKFLSERYRLKIFLTGGVEDKWNAESVARMICENGVMAQSIAGKYPLKEIPNILSGAKILVSVNTGIMHIGAAVGVPLVALHGATSELRWGPLSSHLVVAKSGVHCQPCISLGYESKCTDPICMKHLSVECVIEAVKHVLGEKIK